MMTEWVWDRGVRGAVGVVGVWGRLRGGEASGADLDNVTLDTRLSWRKQTQRKSVNGFCGLIGDEHGRLPFTKTRSSSLSLHPLLSLATLSLVETAEVGGEGGRGSVLKPVIGSHLLLSPVPPNKAVRKKPKWVN